MKIYKIVGDGGFNNYQETVIVEAESEDEAMELALTKAKSNFMSPRVIDIIPIN